jgi:hypothetical protein
MTSTRLFVGESVRETVILALVLVDTEVVLTVKFTKVSPSGTVTDDGTIASALSLDKRTVNPPAGAGPVSVTVAIELLPPFTGFGENTLRDSI